MRCSLKSALFCFFVIVLLHGYGNAAPRDADCYLQNFSKPEIDISIREQPAHFDMSQALADLARMRTSAERVQETHDFQILVRGAGIMSGDISASHAVSFNKGDIVTLNGEPHLCYAISKIDITLSMSPKIYVAEDFNDHPCLFREIFAHEGAHVKIDRDVLQNGAGSIKQALQFAISAPKDYVFVSRPEDVDHAMNVVRSDLGEMLEGLYIAMIQQRNKSQAQLDNPAEYSRIVNECPEITEIMRNIYQEQEP